MILMKTSNESLTIKAALKNCKYLGYNMKKEVGVQWEK